MQILPTYQDINVDKLSKVTSNPSIFSLHVACKYAFNQRFKHHYYRYPYGSGNAFCSPAFCCRGMIKGAELPKKLKEHGYNVSTIERILTSDPSLETAATWKPTPQIDGVRNQKNTLDILRHIKAALTSKEVPIDVLQTFAFFIGGDCSITPGIFSAFHHAYPLETQRNGFDRGQCEQRHLKLVDGIVDGFAKRRRL